MRVKNRGVPLTRRVAVTTVLHYRADCDCRYVFMFGNHVRTDTAGGLSVTGTALVEDAFG